MAVTFTDSIIDGYVWSLERPMYLRYSKDADNSAVVVSIAITQGSYSKTLTLKYSGLIKAIEMNISSLIKSYFQHAGLPDNHSALLETTTFIFAGHTQKVVITITDDDGAINTTQYFIKNSNGLFKNVIAWFGADNYCVIFPENQVINYNINNNSTDFNFNRHIVYVPLYIKDPVSDDPDDETQLEITRRELDDTLIDTISYIDPSLTEDRVVGIPIWNGTDGMKLEIKYKVFLTGLGSWVSLAPTYYTITYKEYCDNSVKDKVYFEGRYGGLETLILANNNDGFNKKSNDFVLQSGDKVKLNVTNRRNGSYISEYVQGEENETYTALFLSESVQTYIGIANDTVSILLTQKSHRIKQIDNSEMKQYTFGYEEVERLKY